MSQEKPPLWRQVQRENFTRFSPLFDFLQLSEENRSAIWEDPNFPLNVPRRLAEKMEKGRLDDPIFRQFVPLKEEGKEVEGFVLDPLQDTTFCKQKKMLQKYQGRVLFVTTSACAMHCRFCFRQNFPYERQMAGFEKEILTLQQDSSITEVILSGGDPLSLSNEALGDLLNALSQIPHIKRIRFHSRFPIGIPERIDAEFLHILSNLSKQIFFVLHCNHPLEIDEEVAASMQKILRLGIPVLNQSVLLRGVNDKEEVLLALSEALVNCGIVPYYLHQLDKVKGTAHFLVPDARALALVEFLQKNTSGYAVPRLVREVPGSLSKTWL